MATQNPIQTYFNPEIAPTYKGVSFDELANSFNNGQEFSNQIQQQQQQGILSQLLAKNTNTDGQVNLANALQTVQSNPNQKYQGVLVNTLSGLLQQSNAAKLKAQQDSEKHQIDVGKGAAEVGEKNLGNVQKRQTLLSNLIATSIDPMDASNKLKLFGSQYGLPQDVQDSLQLQLNNIAQSESGGKDIFEKIKSSYGVLGAEKPIEYLAPTADKILDNQTSADNNVRTTNASIYGADSVAATARSKLTEDQRQFNEDQKLKEWQAKNKPVDYFTAADGTRYAVYEGGKGIPIIGPNGQPVKEQTKGGVAKLSDKALALVNDANTSLAQANQNYRKIGQLVVDLRDGKLNLSAANQASAKAKNFIGMSDENSRGVENFRTVLNQAVNDVLMLAKGTQTEGDAQRAAQVIAADPPRDNASAMQVLNRLAGLQRTIIDTLNQNINGVYNNYGLDRPQQGNQNPKPSVNLGATATRSDVQQAAQKAGVSVQEMAQILKSQGVNVQ